MDPTETLAAFYQADQDFHRWRHRDTTRARDFAREALVHWDNLYAWLRNGGFEPAGYDKHTFYSAKADMQNWLRNGALT